jgi:glycosyltransferase involved in cell wall biosynthesis
VNIALLIGHFPPGPWGGAELQAQSWAKLLAERHRVTVITRRLPADLPVREERDGYTVVRIPVHRLPGWRTLADLGAIDRAVAAIEPKPDVLLCFMTFVSGFAGTRTGRRLGIPAIVWIRGEAEYRLSRSRVHRMLSPRVWCDAAGVLVQSEENRRQLLAEMERYAPARLAAVRERLEVVPNGLELPPGPFTRGLRVLSVGRLIPEKGMDTVIDAAAAASMPLTIAGIGPERTALEARAAARGVDCRFEGYASRERLAALYREAACVVLAARHGEGLPNAVLEAMANARAVVATPCAGTRDLLVDGVTGIVVPPDDTAALASALVRLGQDPALATRLGEAARTSAQAFAWDAVRPKLEACLERWRRGSQEVSDA